MDNENRDPSLDRILELMREELSLALRLYEQAEVQRTALKEHLNGRAVTEATKSIQPTLKALNDCQKKKDELLSAMGVATFDDALARIPYSKEKTRARQTLNRLSGLLKKLKTVVGTSHELLTRDMNYLEFNLNVMTAASAAPGYGTPDAPMKATQGRKLFDESI